MRMKVINYIITWSDILKHMITIALIVVSYYYYHHCYCLQWRDLYTVYSQVILVTF